MGLRPIVLLLLSWATASLLATDCQVRFRRNPCSVSRVSSRVAAAVQVALPMQRLETAQTTFPLPLTANTATKEDGDNPTLSPVMVTLFYPTSGQSLAFMRRAITFLDKTGTAMHTKIQH